jgi:WD40 repeat protein
MMKPLAAWHGEEYIMATRAVASLVGGVLVVAVVFCATDLGPAGETQLPTAAEIRELQMQYKAEHDALLKSGAATRFQSHLFDLADGMAKRGDAAYDAGRLLQASEAYRQARWQLPYQGPGFPDHVARVFGNMRLRHGNEILGVAFSADGKYLATASRDRSVKVWDMANGHELTAYRGHQRYVRCVAFSPDGKWVASAGGDRDIHLWDPQTGKPVRMLKGTDKYTYTLAMVVSPDGKYLLAAGDDRTLRIFDTATGELKRSVDDFLLVGGLRSLALSPDGKRLAGGALNGQVRLWQYPDIVTLNAPDYWAQQDDEGSSNFLCFSPDSKLLLRSGPDAIKIYDVQQPGAAVKVEAPRFVFQPPDDPKNKTKIHLFTCAAFSKDGKTLFTGCTDGVIRLYEMENGQPAGTFKGHNGEITALAFNPQGNTLASASSDYTVRLWHFDIVLQARDFTGHTEAVWCADFSPDGMRLVSCGADHTCRLWDLAAGSVVRTLGETQAGLTAAHFHPAGKSVLIGGGDKMLRLYEADSGKVLQTFAGHTGTVTSAQFNADGSKIVSGGADKQVIIWSTETGKPLATIDTGSLVMAVAFTPDGKQVAAGTVDQLVRLYDTDTGKAGPKWLAHNAAVSALSFDGKGELLASCGFDSLVKIWKMSDPGKNAVVLAGHDGPLSAVAFRADGKFLVSAGNDHVVRLWKLDGGTFKEAQIFRGHKEWITSLAFSRNGYHVLSAGADKGIKLWEVASRELPLTAEHTGSVEAIAVSPDGKLIASGGTDRTIKIWNRATGAELVTIRGNGDTILALAFTPDSKTLFSSSADRNIRRWDVSTGKELPPLENQHQLTGFVVAVPTMALAPDGKKLFAWVPTNERGCMVQLFETKTGDEIGRIIDRDRHVVAVGFSLDGKTAALGAKNGTVRIYPLAEKTQNKTEADWSMFAKGTELTSLAIAPDASFVVGGSDTGTVKVCESTKGQVLQTFDAHGQRVTAVAVSPDGKLLATVGLDNIVKLWDRANGKELRRWALPALVQERGGFVTQLTFTPDGRFVMTANANTTLFLLELP